jgi:hypothetical protein
VCQVRFSKKTVMTVMVFRKLFVGLALSYDGLGPFDRHETVMTVMAFSWRSK